MTSQIGCFIETLRTFTAHIRLSIVMTTYMVLEAAAVAEFLLTNVTREPSTFIV